MKLKSKTQIIINCEELETRFAFLQDGVLEEYEIQRLDDDELVPGSIYLGKITHLEPKLEAAFVDIGAKKNDRVKVPLAIPKSCDFFFWTDQCWLPSNTHTHMHFSTFVLN